MQKVSGSNIAVAVPLAGTGEPDIYSVSQWMAGQTTLL